MKTITPLSKWIPNLTKPLVIAGPCSAETREQVLEIAEQVSKIDAVRIFRAGIWKPRTRPGSFMGVGEEGLAWLKEVKEKYNMMVTTEVANAEHAALALKYGIDILWIGARTTVNPFSVQEIADSIEGIDIPVMIKNPINVDLALWQGAIERIQNAGITKIIGIHRGFSTATKSAYRNEPIWRIPIELKQKFPELPIVCDPSHITGNRNMVPLVCQKAMDVDMDGLMVETHHTPDEAWSDAAQQVTPKTLGAMLEMLEYRTEFTSDHTFEKELNELRSRIDRVDNDILENLALRGEIVKQIGELKIQNNVTALQLQRMNEMLQKRTLQGVSAGLREAFAKEVYSLIHDESVKTQTEMMRAFLKENPQVDTKGTNGVPLGPNKTEGDSTQQACQ